MRGRGEGRGWMVRRKGQGKVVLVEVRCRKRGMFLYIEVNLCSIYIICFEKENNGRGDI